MSQAQPPQLSPTREIELDNSFRATTEKWFEYSITAHPHHTDYGGIVWHGNYLTWMEEARVECLRSLGINYANLVSLGCDLPVIEINLRYHQSMKMGDRAIVKTRMNEIQGVRIHWDYQITAEETPLIYVSGRVTLVGIDREKGKIMRQLPPLLKDALVKL
ncbi:thioesterase family protein [Geminocystis sp. GBBB08]|uniref:acyl-CoA thioesterase n=1 Tax=Geminocystis sp. GBBB08 TaxID=2604140 RepID=UPI0027E3A78B|nr:thioesterase family protein [Geminocystis sp. GBBB08]MBL1211157.1 acyl-CoA thioesterase [Geminocystis sp. GBBB08]